MANNPFLVDRLQGLGTTIFAEMSALAVKHDAVNLGQGMPDTDGPALVADAAIEAIRAGHNQYPPLPGHPVLREAIADHQRRFYDLAYDPADEVLVTAGATEAIAAAILATCESGDEVVMFEPYYDSYAATCALADTTRRVVQLRTPDYSFAADELRSAIGPRTRVLLLNTPHNPTGKVFSPDELAVIAEVAIEHDLIVVSDEVYEHLVFDGRRHVPIATLPGMRERTVTISSGGKTFSFTGWKIGWACAPPELLGAVRTAKQYLTFVNGAPFQHAIAAGLAMPDAFFEGFAAELQAKRDHLSAGLETAGFAVLPSAGTYFVTADITPFGVTDGLDFCRSLPERCGVVAVPNAVFYDDKAAGSPFVRFNFCKRSEVLDEGVRRLRAMGEASR